MLVRASACLEPALPQFLRRIEAPTRSQRLLPAAFWQHAGDAVHVAPWWPAYLRDVRAASQTQEQVSICTTGVRLAENHANGNTTPARPNPHARRKIARQTATSEVRHRQRTSRGFTKSARSTQQAATASRPDDAQEDLQAGHVPRQPSYRASKTTQSIQSGHSRHHKAGTRTETAESKIRSGVQTRAEQLQELINSNDEPRYEEVWQLYHTIEQPSIVATRVLQHLSKSSSRVDLERALSVFQRLDLTSRTSQDYVSAVTCAVGRRDLQLAREINGEAWQHGIGRECSKVFLAHLVRENLWKPAANAFDILDSLAIDPTSDPSSRAGVQDDKWDAIDEMDDLPDKLIALGGLLKTHDPELTAVRPQLERLAAFLLDRLVQSQTIMSLITGNGLSAVFGLYAHLALLREHHHFRALRCLHAMRRSRNRSQLAVLVYQDLRHTFPTTRPYPWVYGTLISMCVDADQPPDILTYLLREFACTHGRADPLAYQRVMTACARQGRPQVVRDVFRELCDVHGVPRDVDFFTPLLHAYARLGDVGNVELQFARLSALDLPNIPNTACWNIRLAAYVRANDRHGALEVFDQIRRDARVRPDAHTFGTLMSMCSNAGDVAAVHELVGLARSYGIQGTSAMVDTLVHAYCLDNDTDAAESLVEATTRMDLEGSPTRMWNILLRHYAFRAEPDHVLRIQERMRELGVRPDDMTYAALMTALIVVGKAKDAMQILRSLHFSRNLTASLFHYSIVLHGFVQEGNRDMAMVIYNEMRERYPRPSPSARLAMLHLQRQRDVATHTLRQQGLERASAVKMMPDRTIHEFADILLDTDESDLATKDPQPGFGRRRINPAASSIYLETVLATLHSDAAFDWGNKFFTRYRAMIQKSSLRNEAHSFRSIQLLTARLIGCYKRQEWPNVDGWWSEILKQATSVGQPLSAESLRRPGGEDGVEQSTMSKTRTTPPRPAGDDEEPPVFFKSMILASEPDVEPGGDRASTPPPRILTTQRHMLSVPLSRYMHALSEQGRQDQVIELVAELEGQGFELTGKNWNTYIQVLSKSARPEHQLLAFELFEEKMLPRTPPWQLLRRGKSIKSLQTERFEQGGVSEVVSRQSVERVRPQEPVPSYFTVVHLGAAMIKFYRRTRSSQSFAVADLRKAAPNTVKYVQQMPYLRDRVQGILLRRRQLRGDLVKKERALNKADRSGVRGSKSPLSHVPVPSASIFSSLAAPNMDKTAALALAEATEGEILRDREVMYRRLAHEHDRRYLDRVRTEESQRLRTVEQMRLDASHPGTVINEYGGEPHLPISGIDPSHPTVLGWETDRRSQRAIRMSTDEASFIRRQVHRFAKPHQRSVITSRRVIQAWKATRLSRHDPARPTFAKDRRERRAQHRGRMARLVKMAARQQLVDTPAVLSTITPGILAALDTPAGGKETVVTKRLSLFQPTKGTSTRLKKAFTISKAAAQQWKHRAIGEARSRNIDRAAAQVAPTEVAGDEGVEPTGMRELVNQMHQEEQRRALPWMSEKTKSRVSQRLRFPQAAEVVANDEGVVADTVAVSTVPTESEMDTEESRLVVRRVPTKATGVETPVRLPLATAMIDDMPGSMNSQVRNLTENDVDEAESLGQDWLHGIRTAKNMRLSRKARDTMVDWAAVHEELVRQQQENEIEEDEARLVVRMVRSKESRKPRDGSGTVFGDRAGRRESDAGPLGKPGKGGRVDGAALPSPDQDAQNVRLSKKARDTTVDWAAMHEKLVREHEEIQIREEEEENKIQVITTLHRDPIDEFRKVNLSEMESLTVDEQAAREQAEHQPKEKELEEAYTTRSMVDKVATIEPLHLIKKTFSPTIVDDIAIAATQMDDLSRTPDANSTKPESVREKQREREKKQRETRRLASQKHPTGEEEQQQEAKKTRSTTDQMTEAKASNVTPDIACLSMDGDHGVTVAQTDKSSPRHMPTPVAKPIKLRKNKKMHPMQQDEQQQQAADVTNNIHNTEKEAPSIARRVIRNPTVYVSKKSILAQIQDDDVAKQK